MATITLNVTGMKCGGCETTVQDKIKALAGVQSVTASHKAKTVDIEYDETVADPSAFRKIILDEGFKLV